MATDRLSLASSPFACRAPVGLPASPAQPPGSKLRVSKRNNGGTAEARVLVCRQSERGYARSMDGVREIRRIQESRPTVEGAGVHLRRAFGHGDETGFDPFLMLDDFRGTDPALYQAGFPWHPHRGIETITYVIDGEVEHGDSLGNSGVIRAGDVQWMTAGSGIIHQEMPRGDSFGRMGGFQLWANLPAAEKMTEPRYRGFQSDHIPEVRRDGALVRVICGAVGDTAGPVRGVAIEPEFLDITLEAGASWSHGTPIDHTYFAYLFEGDIVFGAREEMVTAGHGTVVLLGRGEGILIVAGGRGGRFLLAGGRPLHEAVAWRGPIVMNTQEELDLAWRELDEGTFIKTRKADIS
jgi:redox-sensitive bicupin YhaK (pirin superfamily)